MDSGVVPADEARTLSLLWCSPQWWGGVTVLLSLTHCFSLSFFFFVLTTECTNGSLPWLL